MLKIFKIFWVVIVVILLFLSLFALGPALAIKVKLLNPDFIASEVNRLELAALANDFINQKVSGNLPEGIREAISSTVSQLEPKLQGGIKTSIYQVYDYLEDKRASPDLSIVLRNTILNSDFISSLIDELDIIALIKPVIHEQVDNWISQEMASLSENIYLVIDDVLASQELSIREQLKTVADPLADYLLGEQSKFNLTISTEPFVAELRQRLQQDIGALSIPLFIVPSELFQPVFNQVFDQFFNEIAAQIPASIQIDESFIGKDIPASIRSSLNAAEGNLKQIREYVGSFQVIFIILIIIILILIASICLIYRAVNGIALTLGIILLVSGIAELVLFLFTRNYLGEQLGLIAGNLPAQLHLWLQQVSNHVLAPLQLLSIGFILGGIVLLLITYFYKPRYEESA